MPRMIPYFHQQRLLKNFFSTVFRHSSGRSRNPVLSRASGLRFRGREDQWRTFHTLCGNRLVFL